MSQPSLSNGPPSTSPVLSVSFFFLWDDRFCLLVHPPCSPCFLAREADQYWGHCQAAHTLWLLWAQGSGSPRRRSEEGRRVEAVTNPRLISWWVSLACCICQPKITPPGKWASLFGCWDPLHPHLHPPGLLTVTRQPSQDSGHCPAFVLSWHPTHTFKTVPLLNTLLAFSHLWAPPTFYRDPAWCILILATPTLWPFLQTFSLATTGAGPCAPPDPQAWLNTPLCTPSMQSSLPMTHSTTLPLLIYLFN